MGIDKEDWNQIEKIIGKMTGIDRKVMEESRQTESFVHLVEAFKDYWHCDDDVVLRAIAFWLFQHSLNELRSKETKVDYIK